MELRSKGAFAPRHAGALLSPNPFAFALFWRAPAFVRACARSSREERRRCEGAQGSSSSTPSQDLEGRARQDEEGGRLSFLLLSGALFSPIPRF
eukprot:1950568-Rhodomonas_salina.1